MDASGGDPPPRSRLHPPGILAGARHQEQSVTQRFGNPTIGKQRKSKQFKSARVVKTLPRTGVLLKRLAPIEARLAAIRAEGWLVTRAQQAGLRIEDVARPLPGRRARRNRLDAMIQAALAQMASGQPARPRAGRRRRPKN